MTHRLIVAPHADDETLGCGGLLSKYPAESVVLVLAEPDALRLDEFLVAKRILGYREHRFLNLPDGYVGQDMALLVHLLDLALADLQPDEVYLPYPSLHQDHIAGYEAGMRAARLSMTEGHWFPPKVLIYDVPVYDVAMYPTDLRWNVYESLSDDAITRKVEALAAYSSQLVTGAHPVNHVREAAQALGAGRLLRYAEQYACVREVRQ